MSRMSRTRRSPSLPWKLACRNWKAVLHDLTKPPTPPRTLSVMPSHQQKSPPARSRKKQLQDGVEDVPVGRQLSSAEHEVLQTQLYEQIGRLKTELDRLKKKLPPSVEHKRAWVDAADAEVSVSQH